MARKPTHETQTMTVRVPKDLHEGLRTLAFAKDTSINDIVIKAIADYMSSEGHDQAVEAFLSRAQQRWRVALDKLSGM